MNSKMKSRKIYKLYALEITTTEGCNFNCSYCFERDVAPKVFDDKNYDLLIKRIHELLNNDWFQEEYEGLKIIFWGGEPTMNMSLCERIIQEFQDDERVCFFIHRFVFHRQ